MGPLRRDELPVETWPLLVAYAVLAVGEPADTNPHQPQQWMRPVFERAPTGLPQPPSDWVVQAAADTYLHLYQRQPPRRRGPDPRWVDGLTQARGRLVQPRPPDPASASDSSSTGSPTSAGPTSTVVPPIPSGRGGIAGQARPAVTRHPAPTREPAHRAHPPPPDAAKNWRQVKEEAHRAIVLATYRAQHLAVEITNSPCKDQHRLWTATEAAITGLRPGPERDDLASPALTLCRQCLQQVACAQLAEDNHYTGIAAGRVYRNGKAQP